jgi:hypothetical protein
MQKAGELAQKRGDSSKISNGLSPYFKESYGCRQNFLKISQKTAGVFRLLFY